jgi:hypothetical protein
MTERLRASGSTTSSKPTSALVHTPHRSKANMRADMWDKMKDWLLHGAIEADEKMAADLSGPDITINQQPAGAGEQGRHAERGQASPDDGDALALTFAQPVEPAKVEEEDEEEESGGYGGHSNSGWMR